tara:strand:+ start:163 stop:267 length:105 start_codon:yes stop_codon:yes gene_type:complete
LFAGVGVDVGAGCCHAGEASMGDEAGAKKINKAK